MANWLNKLKSRKQGIQAGMLTGAIAVTYMKLTGIDFMAAAPPGGLIENIVTVAPIDMAFVKVLITALALGGFVGYIIHDQIFAK